MARPSTKTRYADAVAIRVALRSFARRTEEITRRHGLTPQRYTLLLLVKVATDDGRAMTVTALVEPLQTTQSSVTQLVAGVVQRGLLARIGDARDARSHTLHLTPEGMRRLGGAFEDLERERILLSEVVASTTRVD